MFSHMTLRMLNNPNNPIFLFADPIINNCTGVTTVGMCRLIVFNKPIG